MRLNSPFLVEGIPISARAHRCNRSHAATKTAILEIRNMSHPKPTQPPRWRFSASASLKGVTQAQSIRSHRVPDGDFFWLEKPHRLYPQDCSAM